MEEGDRERKLHVNCHTIISFSMTNKDGTEEILRAVRRSLRKSNYSFTDSNAVIISGEQEAIGGWTTANYLEGQLNPPGVSVGDRGTGGG